MAKQGNHIATERSLDTEFKRWLERLRRKWRFSSVADVAKSPDWQNEIGNRVFSYRKVAEQLNGPRIDKEEIRHLLNECWAAGGRFDAIRLGQFLNDRRSTTAIARLVRAFPRRENKAVARIDDFVRRAVSLGYKTPSGGNDFAGAALLASVLLTSLEPKRFVDFRKRHWSAMAKVFGYRLPEAESTGEAMVRAGEFAHAVCQTKTFRQYWPDREPLWVLSGICWVGPDPDKPHKPKEQPPFFPPSENDLMEEGGETKKTVQVRIRNRKVVRLAKDSAWRRDRLLPCDVCGFSFAKAFGKLGKGFIEAHHRKPFSTLKRNHPIREEDLDMVCANCHRTLTRAGETMSVQELEKILDANR